MKIIDVTEFYSERGGGIRSHLTNRGHFLCQRHHDHSVIAPGPREEDACICKAVADGMNDDGPGRSPVRGSSRVIRLKGPTLPYDRTYHLLARLDKIRQRVRRERPDVLEAHSPYLAAAAVLGCGRDAAPVRTLFWHSDHLSTYLEPALGRALGPAAARTATRPLWRGTAALLARFDAVFAAGRTQAERLRAAGAPRVVLAPFGVDDAMFHPGRRDGAWRRRWSPDADGPSPPILVGVGRFAVEKRWDVVLDAFRRVRAHRRAVLVLYGDGPERARLEDAAPEGVYFAGFESDRERLAVALASADVLVHGGPYETFGLSVAEAMASGIPVVVPDQGGAAENVDSASGATYRSLDAAACAAAIEQVLDWPDAERRTRGLAAAARVPTIATHFAIVLATYGELLDEARARSARVSTPVR